MAGSCLPPLPRGCGGSGAALPAREQRENNTNKNNNDDAAAPALSQEPFSQAMLAAGDDVMGLGFSCTGFDASGAPVSLAARGGEGGARAAASMHVVADWDANAGGASRRRGKVSSVFFPLPPVSLSPPLVLSLSLFSLLTLSLPLSPSSSVHHRDHHRHHRRHHRRHHQVFNDPIHGHFYLTPLEVAVVDTPAFQRLRDLKQLGTSYFVFPGACHNRFEHSLGVAHLAREHADRVWRLQRGEVDVERGDVKAVALAGLCHDLGHGPFSHVFERELLARGGASPGWCHEDMSVRVFDSILDSGAVPDGALTEAEAGRVRDIILAGHGSGHGDGEDAFLSTPTGGAGTQGTPQGSPSNTNRFPQGKRWLHELVANGRNGLDVDKFDYLQRDAQHTGCRIAADFNRLQAFSKVIGDETCYKWSEYQNVHEVFRARASLHQRVYTHRKAKAVEYMVVDALLAAEPALRLAERAREVETFVTLDDTVLRQVETWWSTRSRLAGDDDVATAIAESQKILRRLRTRDLYRFCDEFVVPAAEAASFALPTPEEVACCVPAAAASSLPADCRGKLDPRDVILCEIPIDLTAGASNPLDRVSFFHHAGSTNKFRMRREDVSSMLPDVCAERKVRAYCRRTDDKSVAAAVSAAFGSWRARRFGTKVGSSTPQRAAAAAVAAAAAAGAAPWSVDAAIAARVAGSGGGGGCGAGGAFANVVNGGGGGGGVGAGVGSGSELKKRRRLDLGGGGGGGNDDDDEK